MNLLRRTNHAARFPLRRRPAARQGTVLIIVLWIASGLVSTALLFASSMVLEYRAAENSVASMASAQAIEGARRYVAFLLTNMEKPGTMPETTTYEAEQVAVGDAYFWLLGRGTQDTKADTLAFGLRDEGAKLNLNTATREMLEALPCMTAELAGAIIDWRDSDSDVSDNGAETQIYLLRDPKFNCKNSNFETIEELRLLIGGETDVLFGEDTNMNGLLDPNEDDGDQAPPADNRDGRLDPGVLDYVTVFSREANRRSDGSKRINLRNDQGGELDTLLADQLGQSRADEIRTALGQNTATSSVLEFYIRSQMTTDEFAKVADALCVSDNEYTSGLVNVNTASAEVLACLPGIGATYASQLVSYRQGKTTELETLAWVTNVLPQEAAIQAGPYLTAKTSQYTADVVAVDRQGHGFRRILFVLDATGDKPVVIYRRDLTRLGWPLGPDVRNTLAAAAVEK